MMSYASTKNEAKEFAMRTVVTASAIGTTIEWYDFLIYSTAASLVLNKLFFPTADPLIGKLLAIGTIGVKSQCWSGLSLRWELQPC
jgi:MFS transporter, MHS family, shikimate and dehydroshikimate transport protein